MTVINTGAFRNELDKSIKYKTIFDIKFLNKNKKQNKNNESGNLFDKTSKIKKVMAMVYQFFWRHVDCKKIYKKYITDSYDVEIAFLEGISAKIIANSTNKKSKKIAWIHVDLINEKKTEKFFKDIEEEKSTYKKFDNIVAVSEHVKEQVINKFNIPEEKLIVKYNPIDKEHIEKLSDEKVNDITKKKFTICTIGRLSVQKGYDRLLKVVKKLNEDKLDFDLWIIGVGAEESRLKQYIVENNLANVTLLGYKKNPYKYIRESDLFVCSSRAEGFSTVVSEAIILEKPIVTTECSGMKEMLGENNEYGIVTQNDEEALYEGMKEIILDKNKYRDYKNKVKERKDIFDIDKSIESIERVFED